MPSQRDCTQLQLLVNCLGIEVCKRGSNQMRRGSNQILTLSILQKETIGQQKGKSVFRSSTYLTKFFFSLTFSETIRKNDYKFELNHQPGTCLFLYVYHHGRNSSNSMSLCLSQNNILQTTFSGMQTSPLLYTRACSISSVNLVPALTKKWITSAFYKQN